MITDNRAAESEAIRRRAFPMVLTVAGVGDIVIGLFFAIFGPSLFADGDSFLETAFVVIGLIFVVMGIGTVWWGRRKARAMADADPRASVVRRQ